MVTLMKLRLLSGLCALLIAGFAQADEVELMPGHPEHYTVARGDTLWGIAGKFLTRPWQWPEIWRENPRIENPHWIYPGDELVLDVVDGKPRLQVARRLQYAPHDPQSRSDEEKRVPTIRVEPLGQAIPMIPLNAIQPFLMQTKVVEAGDMEQMPYVVDFADEHIAGGAGDRIYVRGLPESQLSGYTVFRAGSPYKDGETGETLGYEALYVADVEFQVGGDPSTMLITKSNRDVRIGDRILPVATERLLMGYQPHPPTLPIQGHIIAVVDGVSQIGQYSVVTIDRGVADGIETGNVFEIRRGGQASIYHGGDEETFNIPSEKEGYLMVFHPYNRVSFALVLNAIRAIQLNDAVVSPN